MLNICYDWADWAISYRRQCWERGGIQTCNNASTIEFQSATVVCVHVCVFTTLITQVDTTVEDKDERVQCSLFAPTAASLQKAWNADSKDTSHLQNLIFAECCCFNMKCNKYWYWFLLCLFMKNVHDQMPMFTICSFWLKWNIFSDRLLDLWAGGLARAVQNTFFLWEKSGALCYLVNCSSCKRVWLFRFSPLIRYVCTSALCYGRFKE